MRRAIGRILFYAGLARWVEGVAALAIGWYLRVPDSVAEPIIKFALKGGRPGVALGLRFIHAIPYAAPFAVGAALLLGGTLLARRPRTVRASSFAIATTGRRDLEAE